MGKVGRLRIAIQLRVWEVEGVPVKLRCCVGLGDCGNNAGYGCVLVWDRVSPWMLRILDAGLSSLCSLGQGFCVHGWSLLV